MVNVRTHYVIVLKLLHCITQSRSCLISVGGENEKKEAEPDLKQLWLTASDVGLPMQIMLDLTIKRILLDKRIRDRIRELKQKYGRIDLEMFFKIGLHISELE